MEGSVDKPNRLPDLSSLHARHLGLTANLVGSWAEAASVCMSKFHKSPTQVSVFEDVIGSRSYEASWSEPDVRRKRAWNEPVDATSAGAYGMVLAAAESHLGLLALSRVKIGSGSDWLLYPVGQSEVNDLDGEIDFEGACRLEVSGILDCTSDAPILHRVKEKVEQLQRGNLQIPGVAGVIGYRMKRIVFRRVG